MNRNSTIKYTSIGVASLLILWLVLSGLLYFMSSGMIFKTERSINTYPQLSNYRQEFYDLNDGTTIDTVYFDNSQSSTVILYLHGNSGRVPHYFTQIGAGYDYYSPANPGFHNSEGTPNTQQIFESSVKAYENLLDKGYDEEDIVIFAHSLGAPTAVHLASVKPNAQSLIIVNGVSSVREICMSNYGIFCAFGGGIMNGLREAEKINPEMNVYQYHLPSDKSVPYWSGKSLHEAINSDNKSFTDLEGYTHVHFDMNKVLENVN